jgi:hypothetical protein
MGMSGQRHAAAALLPVNYLLYTLKNKRLGGPQGPSVRFTG